MKYLFVSLLCFTLVSCTAKTTKPAIIQGSSMGTFYSVSYFPTDSSPSEDKLTKLLKQKLQHVNALMSTYIPSSEVSRFNQFHSTKPFPISQETYKVIQYALLVSSKTQGAFDITVAPLVNLWGFGPTKKTNKVPSKRQIKNALSHVDYAKLTVLTNPTRVRKSDPLLQIDLSAIAKGYAVDVLKETLQEQGLQRALVNIGGEIAVLGKKTKKQDWIVGIEKPLIKKQAVQQRLALNDSAIATSGDYRNFFQVDHTRYAHTINSKTGYPVHRIETTASTSVILPSCMQADAWATAFMALPYKQALTLAKQEKIPLFLIIHTQNNQSFKSYKTDNFTGYLK